MTLGSRTATPEPRSAVLDRHFNSRSVYKKNRFATLAEWRQLAAWSWRFLADRRLVRIR